MGISISSWVLCLGFIFYFFYLPLEQSLQLTSWVHWSYSTAVYRTYKLPGVTHVTPSCTYGKHSTGPSTNRSWVRTYNRLFSCKSVLKICGYRAQSNEIHTYGRLSRGSPPRVRKYTICHTYGQSNTTNITQRQVTTISYAGICARFVNQLSPYMLSFGIRTWFINLRCFACGVDSYYAVYFIHHSTCTSSISIMLSQKGSWYLRIRTNKPFMCSFLNYKSHVNTICFSLRFALIKTYSWNMVFYYFLFRKHSVRTSN